MIINRNLSGGSSVKKWIELFCRKHPYFGIPNLMKYITIANAVLWLLNAVNSRILPYMVFSPYWILRGQVWRLISFIFIPPSTGILAFIAFYFYYFLGSTLEQQWGTARFNLYFFSGVVLTILFGFLIYWITGVSVSLTAYYLFLSMFFFICCSLPGYAGAAFLCDSCKNEVACDFGCTFLPLRYFYNSIPCKSCAGCSYSVFFPVLRRRSAGNARCI